MTVTTLSVDVTTFGENPAYHQLLTGFILLHRAGVIELTMSSRRDLSAQHVSPSLIEAVVDRRHKIAYDVEDGYIVDWDARNRYLDQVDLCFKRSFNADMHGSSPHADKFRPLGLVYDATIRHPFLRWRRMGPREYTKSAIKRLLGREIYPDFRRFEDVPRVGAQPSVLFAARVWDPRGERGERIGDLDEARTDREALNEMRVGCIRMLRDALGPAFVGGLVPTAFAQRAYPDFVTDRSVTDRRAFLGLVNRTDVCVATRGLFGSNGYKIGEYVAASRAIVSERLLYTVPGPFAEQRNYVVFDSPEECAEQAAQLVADRDRIHAIQVRNYSYYQTHARPDRMVLRSLLSTLTDGAQDQPA